MKNTKQISIAVAVTFILTTVLYHCAYFFIPSFAEGVESLSLAARGADSDMLKKFGEVSAIIDNSYINKYDKDKLTDEALSAYVYALGDPYSEYYSKEDYDAVTEMIDGDYKGIGVEVYLSDDGYLTVSTVFDDSPASRAGMQSGDIISVINDLEISEDTYNTAVSMMTGSGEYKGIEELNIKVKRSGEVIDMSLKREEVVMQTVKGRMLKDNIAYIRISQFTETTGKDFKDESSKLISDGAKAMIIDLRNNPGGTLTGVVKVADTILPKGKIVSIKDKSGHETVYKSDKSEIDLPMCVLANGSSASASEVLVGALRDHKKAKFVGEKTFGKGIVQSIYDIKDGSALKITTAKYYTPNGECIHKKGIKPDYEVKIPENVNIYSLSDDEDIQLQKAIEVVKTQM